MVYPVLYLFEIHKKFARLRGLFGLTGLESFLYSARMHYASLIQVQVISLDE
jgi:hypothetical protein